MKKKPHVRTMELSVATASLAEYGRRAKKESLILTVKGKPTAALVPIRNADRETIALSVHPRFLALIERSRLRQKIKGGISPSEMRRRLKL